MALSIIFNLSLFLVITTHVIAGEPQVPCFFIFGDSLVDNGNNNLLRTTAKANYWPYGIDFPAGPTGRFTNGRNVADFIAQLLGFDESIPPFSNATNQDVLRGLNYASGGAGILNETGATFGEVISLSSQLRNHETTISRIAKLVGGERAAKEHLTSCIYYVGMGNNDYLANYLPQLYSSSQTQYTPKHFAALLITQFSHHLRKLYDYGARKVAVFGVGKLGCIPQQLAAYGPSDGSPCFETSNNVVQFFNENLELLIKNLNIGLPDAKFVHMRSSNESYGDIKILSEACCPTSDETGISCGAESVPCRNRDEYYFWDECHPTEAANLIAANNAYAHISPLLLLPHSIHVW